MSRPRRWSDADLRDAVVASATLSEVLRRLGLSKGGASLATVRRRMLELGLDEPGLLRSARSPSWAADPADDLAQAGVRVRWTEAELLAAVQRSTSMREVLQRLGYPASGAAWSVAKAQILRLGLDTAHFGRHQRSRELRVRCTTCHPTADLASRREGTATAARLSGPAPVVESGETRRIQVPLPKGVRVRVPPGAPAQQLDFGGLLASG